MANALHQKEGWSEFAKIVAVGHCAASRRRVVTRDHPGCNRIQRNAYDADGDLTSQTNANGTYTTYSPTRTSQPWTRFLPASELDGIDSSCSV